MASTWEEGIYSADKRVLLSLPSHFKGNTYKIVEGCSEISDSIVLSQRFIYLNSCSGEVFVKKSHDIAVNLSDNHWYTKNEHGYLDKDDVQYLKEFSNVPGMKIRDLLKSFTYMVLCVREENDGKYELIRCPMLTRSIYDLSDCLNVIELPSTIQTVGGLALRLMENVRTIVVPCNTKEYFHNLLGDGANIIEKQEFQGDIQYPLILKERVRRFYKWDAFCDKYGFTNDCYIEDIVTFLKSENKKSYPIIGFPLNLKKQYLIGTASDGDEDLEFHLSSISKTLWFKNYKYTCFDKPIEPSKPHKTEVSTYYLKEYKHYSWFWILIPIVMYVLSCLGISEQEASLKDGDATVTCVILGILYLPLFYLFAKCVKESEEVRSRKIKYSENQIKEKQVANQRKYENWVRRYEKDIEEYKKDMAILKLQLRHVNANMEEAVALMWKESMLCKNPDMVSVATKDLPTEGFSESELFAALMRKFPNYVKIGYKVGDAYYPDIIIDIEHKYFIDIEIDEPYAYKNRELTHYINGGDENRNNYFISKNWWVVRFSEGQVLYDLQRCVEIIEALIKFIESGKSKYLNDIWKLRLEICVQRWTREDAKLMLIDSIRDNMESHYKKAKPCLIWADIPLNKRF